MGGYKSSGEITSSSAAASVPAKLGGLLILTDGTNDATVILYDAASATGTKLWEAKVPASDEYGGCMFPEPIEAMIGIWAELSGTGASCIVYYR